MDAPLSLALMDLPLPSPHSPLRRRRVGKAAAASSSAPSPTLVLQLASPASSRSSSVSRSSEISCTSSPPLSPPPLPPTHGDDETRDHPPHFCFCEKCVPPTPGAPSSHPGQVPTPAFDAATPNATINSRIQAFIRESRLLWVVFYLLAFVLRWSTACAMIQLPILAYLCYAWWDPSAASSSLFGGLPPVLVTLTGVSLLELALSLALVIPHRLALGKFYDQPGLFPSATFDANARWEALRQLVQAVHPGADAFLTAAAHPTLATPAGRALLRASRPRASAAGQPYSTVPHIGHFWQGWFKGAAPCDVKRDNVKEWLTWAFFNRRWEEMGKDSECALEVEDMVQYLESETGAKVPHGYNPEVKCMRVTLDEKRIAWRGGIYYAYMTIVNLSIILLFRLLGYTNIYSPASDMILHIPSRYTNPSPTALSRPMPKPILLLHGLAVGMTPYLPWCLYMYLTTGRPTVFLHMPCVSIRLFAPHPPTPARFNHFLQSTWQQFPHLPRATLVGSSLGTAVAAWAIKDPLTMEHVVDSAVLTDPISFGLCFVDVAQNFLYKSPANWAELAIRALGAREPNVASYLYRHFWWFENVVWPSEWKAALETSTRAVARAPASATNPTGRLAIFLSEMDSIVNSEAVLRYVHLQGETSVTVIPDAGHGAFVFTPGLWGQVKQAVQETARNAGAAEEEIERRWASL